MSAEREARLARIAAAYPEAAAEAREAGKPSRWAVAPGRSLTLDGVPTLLRSDGWLDSSSGERWDDLVIVGGGHRALWDMIDADLPPDDGKTLIAGVLYDDETGQEADPQ